MANTVLVVDDEERLRSLLRAYLAQEGYHVLTAADGREALHLARPGKPDLIILGVIMPEMGRLGVLQP
jgi:DNA-binding response OmpR family regulator